MVRAAVLLLLAGLLSGLVAGCGFHLRGAQPLAESWQTTSVRDLRHAGGRSGSTSWHGGDRDELQRTVARALADAGVQVSTDAALVVELLGEQVTRRASAIGAAASAAEYQLDYELRYRVVDAGQQVRIAEQRIHRDRIYRYNETAPMGSAEEEALLRREMRQAAARQLASQFIRRGRGVAPDAPAPAAAPAPGTSPGAAPDASPGTAPADESPAP